MQPKDPTPSQRRMNAVPSFERLDQGAISARAQNSAFNTGFREWLRKITSSTNDATSLAFEQIRLEQVKKLIGDLLGNHVAGMSSRDQRLYFRIISASQMAIIREARFECFDLMCRKISEQAAVQKLQELDRLVG
jgi:hypothetical protein